MFIIIIIIIELRFTQYLEGDYTNLLTEWRAAIAKNERQRKPPKNDDAHRRVTKCIKLFNNGHVSRGLRQLEGKGKANSDDPNIIAQMAAKHPNRGWTPEPSPHSERPNLGNLEKVVKTLNSQTSPGPRGLSPGLIKQLFSASFSTETGRTAKNAFVELGQVYLSREMPTWL